jgi:hypothetical protein
MGRTGTESEAAYEWIQSARGPQRILCVAILGQGGSSGLGFSWTVSVVQLSHGPETDVVP